MSKRSPVAPFHSLLVPIDLTPISDRVLSRVALLPLSDEARVTLLHVVPADLPVGERRSAEHDAHQALVAEARHLRGLLGKSVRIELLVRHGAAAGEIVACAGKVRAELIVMGRAGGRPLRDAFLGSTAERVVRQSRLPVLAIRLAARAAYHRPTVALDLDPVARDVVRVMLRVLPPPHPSVTVIHAFDTPYRRLIYPSLHEAEAAALEHEHQAKASRALGKLLADALAKANVARDDAPFWKTHVRCGSPRLVVEKAVLKSGTDLLVLGTRGYAGAAFVLLGTVAGDLLRATKCDVLVVPPTPAGH